MSKSLPHPDDLAVHAAFLRRLARSLLRSTDLADDAVQETLVLAWKKRPEGPHPRGWMAGTLRNVVRNLRRGRGRRDKHEERVGPAQAATPKAIRERELLRKQLLHVLLALPEPVREVVLLRHDQGLPPRRIASALGIPVHTVHNRLRSGLAQMRRELEQALGTPDGTRGGWRGALAALVPTLTPTPALPFALGGLLMSKALWLTAATLLLLAVGWVVVNPLGDGTASSETRTGAAPLRDSTARRPAHAAELHGRDGSPPGATSPAAIKDRLLHGVVLHAGTNQAVEGALVRAFDFLAMTTIETRTDAEGKFAFRSTAASQGAFQVRVEAAGLAPADFPRVLASVEGLSVALLGAGWIEGTVSMASGDALGEALRVRTVLRRHAAKGLDPALELVEAALPSTFRPRARVAVDPDTGSFRLGPLAPGKHALEFLRPGLPLYLVVPKDAPYAWEAGFVVAAGQTVNVGAVTLQPDAELLVHLIDAATETTLTRATFESYNSGDVNEERFPLEITGRTGEGFFRIPARGLGPQRLSLNATAHVTGYAPADIDVSGSWGRRPLVIRMHRDASIAVHVHTERAEGATGIAYVRRSDDGALLAVSALDEHGAFQATALPAGVALEVLVFDQDLNGRRHAARVVLKPGEHRKIELGGPGGTAIHGVVRKGGAPVAGVLVAVDDVRGTRVRIWTGRNGHFRVDGLPAGFARVFLNLGEGVAMVTQRVMVVEGQTADVSVDLLHEIHGQVIVPPTEQGKAPEGLPGVLFRLGDPLSGGIDVEVRPSRDGTIQCWLPRVGHYRLLSEDDDYYVVSPTGVRVQAGERTSLDVQMARDPGDGIVTLSVRDAKTEQAVSGAALTYRARQRSGMATAEPVGVIILENALLGRYDCQVAAPGYVGATLRVDLTHDQNVREIVVALRRSESVRITSFATGSRGEAAGLLVGDDLRSYDGKPVLNLVSLRDAMAGKRNTDLVSVEIQRGARRLTLDLPGGRLGIHLQNVQLR